MVTMGGEIVWRIGHSGQKRKKTTTTNPTILVTRTTPELTISPPNDLSTLCQLRQTQPTFNPTQRLHTPTNTNILRQTLITHKPHITQTHVHHVLSFASLFGYNEFASIHCETFTPRHLISRILNNLTPSYSSCQCIFILLLLYSSLGCRSFFDLLCSPRVRSSSSRRRGGSV